MFSHILVVADQLAKNKNALKKAEQLCSLFGSRVTVVRFLSEKQAYTKHEVDEAYQTLEAAVSTLREQAPVTLEVVITSDIANWILAFSAANAVDLIVKTGNRSESDFYTPTDWKLIRSATCSVLVAGHRSWKKTPVILSSVDAKSRKQRQLQMNATVLRAADNIAHRASGKHHCVSCIPVAKPLIELDIADLSAIEQKSRPAYEAAIAKMSAEAGVEAIRLHINAGTVEKVIAHSASSIKADLIIIGSIGRKGASGFLIGNSAERALRFLSSDVLVLRD